MRKFIAIRPGPNCRPGDWFIAEDVGEPLYRCRIEGGPRGVKLIQTSRVGIPFESLAAFIIEPGFRIPRSLARIKNLNEEATIKEILDFQSATEEIIEEELLERGKAADPSIIGPSGVVVPGDKDANS